MSGHSGTTGAIPLETFKSNKEMGRILLRRGGETVAAGELIIGEMKQNSNWFRHRD